MKIRKALLSCVLVLAVALVCFFALPIDAEAATSGDYTYTVSDGKATITVCSTSISGDVTIPSTLGGYPVTAIGDRAFSGCTGLTSVTIPDSFTSINDYAFSDCTELESVNLPNGITSIGMRAFSNCKKLTEIYIPSSILSIGNSPFFNCTSIVGIWVDENNANYSSDAQGILYNKDKTVLIQAPGTITSCVIPAGVKEIDSYAFYRCYLLADITVPDGVIKIDAYAFKNCTSLTSIIIPDGVERIGQESFMFCTSLVSVTIPQSVS